MRKREGKDEEKRKLEETAGDDKAIVIKVADHRSSKGSKEECDSTHSGAEITCDDDRGGEHTEMAGEEKEVNVTDQDTAVTELRAKADEYLDHLQRLKAEFENYRKRMTREREENWRRARGDLILSLVPYVDDMKRFLDSPGVSGDPGGLIEGIRLIEKGIMDILKKEGLEEIDAEGKPFDPTYHEAVEIQSVDDRSMDYIVAEVLVRGFMYRNSLLRPARVKVYKYVEPEKDGAGDSDEAD